MIQITQPWRVAEMAQEKPSLITPTKLNNEGSKDVKVQTKRKVTYIINATSASKLSIPYASAVNGTAKPSFKNKPDRVSGSGGKIIVDNLDPGSKVTLYLNSDSHPSYRKNPVYEVTVNERDAIVTITEKSGKHEDTDTPVRIKDKNEAVEAAKKWDTYSAPLTGDIWMKVSHEYTSAEVDALMPADTSAEVIAAIKKIYTGLETKSLSLVTEATKDKPSKTIAITFDDSQNPLNNINKGYGLLTKGVKLVHPAGYAALFNAAVTADVTKLSLSSAWRPMLGSIAHRAGLGLDVNYLGATKINRQELRNNGAVDTTNVSEEEKKLLKDFEKKKIEQESAKKKADQAAALAKKSKDDPIKGPAALEAEATAKAAKVAADKARVDAEAAWNAERDKNEPEGVRLFRGSLMKCRCVAQLFDPWFMDDNNLDNTRGKPNMQKTGNETLHAHHLHITVSEPKIL
jgi:hypothetical protein